MGNVSPLFAANNPSRCCRQDVIDRVYDIVEVDFVGCCLGDESGSGGGEHQVSFHVSRNTFFVDGSLLEAPSDGDGILYPTLSGPPPTEHDKLTASKQYFGDRCRNTELWPVKPDVFALATFRKPSIAQDECLPDDVDSTGFLEPDGDRCLTENPCSEQMPPEKNVQSCVPFECVDQTEESDPKGHVSHTICTNGSILEKGTESALPTTPDDHVPARGPGGDSPHDSEQTGSALNSLRDDNDNAIGASQPNDSCSDEYQNTVEVGDFVLLVGQSMPREYHSHVAIITALAESHCTVIVLDDSRRFGIGECWPGFDDVSQDSTMLRLGARVAVSGMQSARAKHLNALTGVISKHPSQGHPSFIKKPSCPDKPQLTVCVAFDDPALAKERSALLDPRFLIPLDDAMLQVSQSLEMTVDKLVHCHERQSTCSTKGSDLTLLSDTAISVGSGVGGA